MNLERFRLGPIEEPLSRRELAVRIALAAGAVVCLLLAVLLVLLAIDVARVRDAVNSGDVRYRAGAGSVTLWDADEIVPLAVARNLLGTKDDVEFRLAVRALRVSRLGDPSVSLSDPEFALLRNEAQARLEAVFATDPDPSRRSRAAGLLGVLGLARLITETEGRSALLSSTIANLQRAIALDPTNDDAKYNLELAYQRASGVQLTEGAAGLNPSPGGSGAKGAGAGQPGTGY